MNWKRFSEIIRIVNENQNYLMILFLMGLLVIVIAVDIIFPAYNAGWIFIALLQIITIILNTEKRHGESK